MAETKEKTAEVGQDQSMEEILQSIRRIIAEESDDVTPESNAPNSESLAGSDVLELTEIVPEDAPPAPAAPAKADVLSAIDSAIAPAAAAPAPAPAPEKKPEPLRMEPLTPPPSAPPPLREEKATPQPAMAAMKEEPEFNEGLISRASAEAASSALRSLSENATRRAHTGSAPAFRSGTTIEDLTMEALRPMLKEWLDTNLPSLVERIVQREIRKLADRNE